jgi:hypothetical protein
VNHRLITVQRLAALTLLITSTAAGAATLLTADDKTVTGDLKAFEDGALVIEPKPGETTRIPLADLVQATLTWQERISAAPRHSTAQPKSAATQANAPRWKLELANGDRITASLKSWDDNSITFSASTLEDSDVTVPIDQVQALWTPAEQLAFKARAIGTPATGVDVAYVEKDGDVKAVTGQVTGADQEFLKFKWEGQERKIRLERLVGLVLSQREQPATPNRDAYELFTLSTGELISGNLAGFEKGDGGSGAAFVVKPLVAASAPAFHVPLAKLEKITIKNGAVVWLTDLTPSSVVQTPYFDRLIPYRIDKNLSGGKLALTDGAVDRGIAVHSKCFLAYDIGGRFETFRAKVGFQQDEGKLGRAAIRVVADDKVLWEDPDLKGPARPAVLNLDIKGVKTLRLEVDYGKEQDVGDQIVWGEPRLVRARQAPRP